MSEYLKTGMHAKPVNPSLVQESWAQRGYSFHLITDPAAQEWNNFVHSTDELLTVVTGKLKLIMDGAELVCNPGDEVFIPRNVNHSVKNINTSTTKWIYGYN